MTSRIVVGIDGSPQSANALEWAIARAALDGHDLDLINAFAFPADLSFYGYHGMGAAAPLDWFTEYARDLLESATKRVHEVAPSLTVTQHSEVGPAAHILLSAGDGASAIVVGRRGLGGARSALLGSVSNKLTVEATCPVIVVGDNPAPTSGPVVVGVDGSDFSTAALRFAVDEATLRRTSVRTVTAYDLIVPTFPVDAEFMDRVRAGSEASAHEVADHALAVLRAAGGQQAEVEQVTVEGRAADGILAHSDGAQLVVVGSHGKGLVRRMLLGSVSRQVLHDSEIPVAVVNLPDPDED